MPRFGRMNVDLSKKDICSGCFSDFVTKWFLILTTFICVLGGLVIFIGAVWIMVDQSAAEGVETQEKIQGIRTGATVLLLGGLAVICINATGCFGAFFLRPKLLLAFIILVALFLVIPEIILIIWFLVSRGTVVELTDGVVSRNMRGFITQNQTDGRIFMTNIQSTLECCGFNGISDYMTDEQRDTCLAPGYEKNYFIEGCKTSMARMFAENIIIIGVVEITHLIISILAMVAAWKLRKGILLKSEGKVEDAMMALGTWTPTAPVN